MDPTDVEGVIFPSSVVLVVPVRRDSALSTVLTLWLESLCRIGGLLLGNAAELGCTGGDGSFFVAVSLSLRTAWLVPLSSVFDEDAEERVCALVAEA